MARRIRRAFRGVGLRLLGLAIGAVIALAGLVAMQLPLLHPTPVLRLSLAPLPTSPTPAPPSWPTGGPAAIDIPSFGVLQSHHDAVVPIASVTKLMTAYLVLSHLPLGAGQTGPCVTVSPGELTTYYAMKDSDQSSIAVAAGEQLCENQLLEGMLVHSASNFAAILADMVDGTNTAFVADMNATAARLQLTGTHYVDVSGYDAGNVSTAIDQVRLAALLMTNPTFAFDVDQPFVTLPVAGTVGSYTPFVGTNDVIGVKSGRTQAAGGCDVLAWRATVNGQPTVVLAAVFDQRGGDLLGPAGAAALALAQSVFSNAQSVVLHAGTVLGSITWGDTTTDIVLGPVVPLQVAPSGTTMAAVSYRTNFLPIRHALSAGSFVGTLAVTVGTQTDYFRLVTTKAVHPPTLWQRLR